MTELARRHSSSTATAWLQKWPAAAYAVLGLALTGAYFALPAGSAAAHLVYELLALSGLGAVLFGVARHRPSDAGWSRITSGFSVYPADGASTQERVDSADRAMYRRKSSRPRQLSKLAR